MDFDKWTFTFDKWQLINRINSYLCSMKKHESKDYNRFIILLWITIGVFVWIKLLHKAPLSEVVLVTIGYVTPIIIVNLILCNFLLPKAIQTKRMNTFVIHFILLTLLTALILSLILLGIRHLEQIGFLPHQT